MKKEIFRGVATALVTPFIQDGTKIDFDAFAKHIEEQIANGVSALVFLGTTGEPATMTQDECDEVIKFAVKHVNHRVPVIAGAGGNNTRVAVEKSKRYESFGVDALLHVTPYYNKATQSGLVEHYTQIASAVKVPIILYNVPGRTGVNIQPSTLKILSKIPNIVAVKEASGNIEQITEIIRICGDDMPVYSGDDGLTYSILALGGIGVISVASNVVPKQMHDLCETYFAGDINKSRDIQLALLPLIKSLFIEVNPIPAKTALAHLGKMSSTLRLPLTQMSDENKQKLFAELKKFC
ncbi:MAG: 4-hydroxy-tetrahydrodipicolinate synthase [Christensenellales bacterium]